MVTSVAEIANYEEKVAYEKALYEAERYDPEKLMERVSRALEHHHKAFHAKVRRELGLGPWEYIVSLVNALPGANILSIGSGPCGLEIDLARNFRVPFAVTCVDINENALRMGLAKAKAERLDFKIRVQDANFLKLADSYDLVLAHASLHHLVNLESLFEEIHDHLTPRGTFVVFEYVPRNGMLLWPETKELVNRLFTILPERYRRDCRDPANTVVREAFPEEDTSAEGFECIRSQDIVPLLEKIFHVEAKVAGYAFTRRFVDAFGGGYELDRREDKLVIDMLLVFDEFIVSRGMLKPETVFMSLKRR